MKYLYIINNAVTNWLADWASVIGIIVALIGFYFTIKNVRHSKSVAEKTEEAVNKLREDSIRINFIEECSSAISLMEHIKTIHRQNPPSLILLPDKYSTLRKTLISIKNINSDLNSTQKSKIQSSITIIRGVEEKIENALSNDSNDLDMARLNTLISEQIDILQEILTKVKDMIGR